MGLIPKYKREKQKLIRREAKAVKKRGEKVRSKIVRFLIVCEGSETEPNWAKEKKDELERASQLRFDRIWVVFDKDDNNDFDKAIELARKYGFQVAWSNEAFELWFLLHFQYCDTAISRTAYIEKLESKIRECKGYKTYRYEKNSKKMYDIITSLGNEKSAISYARRLRSTYSKEQKFSEHNPCTTVDRLIEELRCPEKFL